MGDAEDSGIHFDIVTRGQCGGGGRPDWSYKLSFNHFGGMDGARATFLYAPKEQALVYSTGCEQELTQIPVAKGDNDLFDPSHKEADYQNPHLNNIPQDLILSPDKTILTGVLNGNIVLYTPYGFLEKTLTSSGKAYGPVFSKDGKTIFYGDNLYGNPTLARVSTDGTNQKALYTTKTNGAISNISVSPDNSKLIFTLIHQDKLPEGNNWPDAAEDLYTINPDGNNLQLFLKGTSQASWNPQ